MARLVFSSADFPPLELQPGPNALGRTKDCALVVAHADLSRRHAQLTVEAGGEVLVEDLGSRNGTFVNGVRVQGKQRLAPGDRVRFGQVEAVLESAAASPAGEPVPVKAKASAEPAAKASASADVSAAPAPKASAEPAAKARADTDVSAAPAPKASADPAAKASADADVSAAPAPKASGEPSGKNRNDTARRARPDSAGKARTDSAGKVKTDSAGKVKTDSAGKVKTDSAGKVRTRGRAERKRGSRALKLVVLLAILVATGGLGGAVAVTLFRAKLPGSDVAEVISSTRPTARPRASAEPLEHRPNASDEEDPAPSPGPGTPTPDAPSPLPSPVAIAPSPEAPGTDLPEAPETGPAVVRPTPPPPPPGPDAPAAAGPVGPTPPAASPEPEDPVQVEIAALLKRAAANDAAARDALRKRHYASLRHEGALGPAAARRVLDLVRDKLLHGEPLQLVAPALARSLRGAHLKLEVHELEVRTSYVQDYAKGFGRLVGKQRLAPHPKTVKVDVVELPGGDGAPKVLGSYSKGTPALDVPADSVRGLSEAEVWEATIDGVLKALAAWPGKV